jgi:hypothetical protein
MFQFEIKKLAELQTCMTKKIKPKKRGGPDVQQQLEGARYLPEKRLREAKLLLHLDLFREAHK